MKRLLALLLLLTGCEATDSAQLPQLVIAGGGFADISGDIRSVAPMPVEVLLTGSSDENIRLVAEGKAHAGFAGADVSVLAIQGELPFTRALPLQALAVLPEDYLQIAVRADTALTAFADLANRKVVIGPAGGANITANRVIDASGIKVTRAEMSTAEAGDAMRSGDVAAIMHVGPLNSPVMAGIGVPVRLIPVPVGVAELANQFGDIYLSRSIPPGTYNSATEVSTIGIPNVLLVRADLPEKAAYQLTGVLFRAWPQLDRRLATAAILPSLHPGAMRYYRGAKPFVGTQ